jgi:sugar transferase EpsL
VKYYRIKRALDVVAATIILIVATPMIAIIALLVRIKLGSPVLFRQQRPGLHGKPFTMLKFRTMTDERHEDGYLLPDQHRITSFGRFLRSTSLDELPELFNVLRGEMSLVGPRPLLMEYLDRYTADQMRRHDILPGITGWAAVNGRNMLSWEEKFTLDLWYVEHQSFGLDVKILILTIWKVLKREGINQSGREIVEKFRGG